MPAAPPPELETAPIRYRTKAWPAPTAHRHAAIYRQADIDPAHPGQETPQSPGETDQESSAPRRRACQQAEQHARLNSGSGHRLSGAKPRRRGHRQAGWRGATGRTRNAWRRIYPPWLMPNRSVRRLKIEMAVDQGVAHPALHRKIEEGRVVALADQRFGGNHPVGMFVEHANIGTTADRQVAARYARIARASTKSDRSPALKARHFTRPFQRQWQQQFDAGCAGCGFTEGYLFFVFVDRRVIGT